MKTAIAERKHQRVEHSKRRNFRRILKFEQFLRDEQLPIFPHFENQQYFGAMNGYQLEHTEARHFAKQPYCELRLWIPKGFETMIVYVIGTFTKSTPAINQE